MVKVSVIIPVYKTEAYLEECVAGVQRQALREIEIILVDDGSPDRCGDICDRMACEDKRIKVIHKSNGGVSDARNAGMKIAVGEYVGFVDSDDTVSEYMFKILYQLAKKHEADIAECGFTRDPNTLFHGSEPGAVVVRHENILSAYFRTNKTGVWGRIYRRTIVDGFAFEVGLKHEDVIACYQFFSKCRCYVSCDNELYFYRTGLGLSKAKIDSFELQSVRVAKLCKMEFPPAYPDAMVLTYLDMCNYMKRAVICGFTSTQTQRAFPTIRKKWSKYLRAHIRGIFTTDVYSSREKIQLVSAGVCYPLFRWVCKRIIAPRWQKQAAAGH